MDKNRKGVLILLEGKIAVVSGAATGIGFASAKKLGKAGAKIVLLDIDEKKGDAAERKLKNEGIEVMFLGCDVSSEDDCRLVTENIKARYGRVDILFNNAGIVRRKNTVELSKEEWDLVLAVNLTGIYLLSKCLIPLMVSNGGGSIINTASGWGLKGGDNAVSYCASKGGVINMTRAMAIDHGKDSIRVNSVSPGDTDTKLLWAEARQLGENIDQFLQKAVNRPIARLGAPEDIANAVLFLASDLSSWITGTDILVDGGGLA